MGGDFYDFFFVDAEWLCVVIGDVAGKGVPAALYMAVTMTLLKAHTAGTLSPARILARVNRELCRQNDTGMFVTVFCALLNCRTSSLVYCNAGHGAPFVLSSSGAMARLSERGGTALGADAGSWYEDADTRLRAADTLFCCTDGVTEATDGAGNFFGDKRLATLLAAEARRDAAALTRRVIEEVERFAGDGAQADDVTVLALRYLGVPAVPARKSAAAAAA